LPPERRHRDDPSLQPGAVRERKEAFFDTLNDTVAAAVKATVEDTFQELEQERQ
jgi:hypothetical protein